MKCDCLNECGDDPWLKTGQADPCEGLAQKMAEAEQRRADLEMLNYLHANMSSRDRQKPANAALGRILKGLV